MQSYDEAFLPFLDPEFDSGFECTPWAETDPTPTPESGLSLAEQRRIRRMMSNRESARRSRMRKQRHLEELRSRLTRLRAENQELTSRLGGVAQQCLFFHSENHWLRAESDALRRRLLAARRVLLLRRLQRLMSMHASGFEQTWASLIS
ncbi:bZIP transcription factor RISBZ5-like [Typha latifolia]|uniref:bZIP transcription factor RISBZ5-like n=1 Tax=Typha latifolia TaxID=4733 RepID=UPI003C2D42C7